MQYTDPKERSYLRVAVTNEIQRLEIERGIGNAPFGGWRNTAVQRIADREGMNPYDLDRIIRKDRPDALTDDVCLDIAHAPVYPERFGMMVAVMLDGETLDTVRDALADRSRTYVGCLSWDDAAPIWAVRLWAIDRACRALGIES